MRLTLRLEKRLARARLFGYTDGRLGRHAEARDAIVIAGFWRSGTTLLLDLVARLTGARTFFEPLHFQVPQARPFHAAWRFEARGRTQGEACPYVRPQAGDCDLGAFLDDVLRGRVSTAWTRKARRVRQLLGRPVTVKFVRGNLLLGYIEQRYTCRSLFIVRHPCAVVASLQRGEANRRIYSSEEFLQLLLAQTDLQDDYLAPYADHIERWRHKPLHRLALVHAITQLVPLNQLETGTSHALPVIFEELALHPEETIRSIGQHLGVSPGTSKPTDTTLPDSLTTKRSREGVAPHDRCFAWQRELPPGDIDSIHAIYLGFGATLTRLLERFESLARPTPPPSSRERADAGPGVG